MRSDQSSNSKVSSWLSSEGSRAESTASASHWLTAFSVAVQHNCLMMTKIMPIFFLSVSLSSSSSSTTSVSSLNFLPPDLTFWFYVKEHLNRHELQRFYSLRHISSELGRGRAWLRCALNEHSLERYLHSLLADHPRLGLVDCLTFFPNICWLHPCVNSQKSFSV